MLNETEYLDPEDLDPFREHLPLRKTSRGEVPTMKNEFVNNGKSWRENSKNGRYPWHHMATITDDQPLRRKPLGLVIQLAIQVMF